MHLQGITTWWFLAYLLSFFSFFIAFIREIGVIQKRKIRKMVKYIIVSKFLEYLLSFHLLCFFQRFFVFKQVKCHGEHLLEVSRQWFRFLLLQREKRIMFKEFSGPYGVANFYIISKEKSLPKFDILFFCV